MAINSMKIRNSVGLTPTAQPSVNVTAGDFYFDSTANMIEYYNGTTWLSLSSLTGTETLTNKTLTSPAISGATVTGATTLTDASTIVNATTASKVLAFSLSGMTAARTLTLSSSQSTTQTLTIPNITAADTLATLGLAQTFSGATTLSASGTALSVTNNATVGGVLSLAAGTAAAPSLNFTADTTTGLFDIGSNVFGMSSGGTEVARIQSGQLNVTAGTDTGVTGVIRAGFTWTTAAGANGQTGTRIFASNSFDGTMTAGLVGMNPTASRTITNSQSDAVSIRAVTAQTSFTVPSTKTYTNTSDVSTIFINSVPSVSGTLALTDLNKLYILADSTATGTYKNGILIGLQSGASNNAAIADNTSYSGSFFINQSGSAASVFGGTITSSQSVSGSSNSITATNTNAAASSSAQFILNSDTGTANIVEFSSGTASSAFNKPNGLKIANSGSGGISLACTNASGVIDFWPGNLSTTAVLSLSAAGLVTIGVSGGIVTHVVNGGLNINDTGAGATGLTVTSTLPQLKLVGDSTSHSPGTYFLNAATSGHYNWMLAAQQNISNGFEITPSTATDGSTFTTPAFSITQAGIATITNSTGANVLIEPGLSSSTGVQKFIGASGSGFNNWMIGANFNHTALEFTPSTVADGTSFTTSAMTLTNTGNAHFIGTLTVDSIIIGGNSVIGSTGTPQNITAAGGIVFASSASKSYWFVQGSGGAVTVTANPQIAVGSTVGQELELVGTSNTNTLTLSDGTGLSLNGAITLSNHSVITLVWDGALWVEVSRR